MTRDDYRRQTVAASRHKDGIWLWLVLIASIPFLLPMFLGDILAAPFTARRNESTFRWFLFTFARFLGPVIIIGACIGYLIKRHR